MGDYRGRLISVISQRLQQVVAKMLAEEHRNLDARLIQSLVRQYLVRKKMTPTVARVVAVAAPAVQDEDAHELELELEEAELELQGKGQKRPRALRL